MLKVAVRVPLWKRVEDVVLGVPAALAAAPLVALAAVAVVLDDGLPVFYRDERVGLGGRRFTALKLRTMVRGAAGMGLGPRVARDDPRITRVGRFLRRWSLDELPQLWNVVRGEMSLVGPRPTYSYQVERYSPPHLGRLRVKPGITGLAQVSGRNALSWEGRIELDLAYVARMSPLLDLAILLRTPLAVVASSGLYGRSGVTRDYGEPTDQS